MPCPLTPPPPYIICLKMTKRIHLRNNRGTTPEAEEPPAEEKMEVRNNKSDSLCYILLSLCVFKVN